MAGFVEAHLTAARFADVDLVQLDPVLDRRMQVGGFPMGAHKIFSFFKKEKARSDSGPCSFLSVSVQIEGFRRRTSICR